MAAHPRPTGVSRLFSLTSLSTQHKGLLSSDRLSLHPCVVSTVGSQTQTLTITYLDLYKQPHHFEIPCSNQQRTRFPIGLASGLPSILPPSFSFVAFLCTLFPLVLVSPLILLYQETTGVIWLSKDEVPNFNEAFTAVFFLFAFILLVFFAQQPKGGGVSKRISSRHLHAWLRRKNYFHDTEFGSASRLFLTTSVCDIHNLSTNPHGARLSASSSHHGQKNNCLAGFANGFSDHEQKHSGRCHCYCCR